MVRLIITCVFVFAFIETTLSQNNSSADSFCVSIIENMLNKIENLESAHFSMSSSERYEGEYYDYLSEAYIQFAPRRVYIKVINEDGSSGSEILYKEGENDNDVLISPNKFPYFNLSFSTENIFLRRNRHHTLLEAGGKYMATVVEASFEKALKGNFNSFFKMMGDTTFNEKECYILHVDNPDFKYQSYKVESGETVKSISRKLAVSEYKLVEHNENISDYHDDIKGKIIQVPNSYSKHFVLFIEKETALPLYQEIHDEIGLFSKYAYLFFTPDVKFSEKTFDKENPEYGF